MFEFKYAVKFISGIEKKMIRIVKTIWTGLILLKYRYDFTFFEKRKAAVKGGRTNRKICCIAVNNFKDSGDSPYIINENPPRNINPIIPITPKKTILVKG